MSSCKYTTAGITVVELKGSVNPRASTGAAVEYKS